VEPLSPDAAGSSGRLPWLALFVLTMGTFMVMVDSSVVTVALPKLMAVYNATADQIQWVVTAYTLVEGMVIPATGYLGDRFGCKAVLVTSTSLFTATSLLCGVSWSLPSLIAARALQAASGGMMIPLSMTFAYRIWPREKIGVALGVWGLTMALAPAIGPTLGGYLVDTLSWRYIFFINLPVGLVTVLLGWLSLTETPRRKTLRLDWVGLGIIAVTCFLFLLVLSKGQDWGWTAERSIVLFVLSLFGFVLFILWELGTTDPVLDLRLLGNFTYVMSLAGSSLTMICVFIGVFVVPIFTQDVQGYSALQSGLIMLPPALVSGFFMIVSGLLYDKYGAAIPIVAGSAILVAGTYILSGLAVNTPASFIKEFASLRALGLGLSMGPLMTVGLGTVPEFRSGHGSALLNMTRQVSTSLGIALVTFVLMHQTAFYVERLGEGVTRTSLARSIVYARLAGMFGGPGLYAWLSSLVHRQAAVQATGDAFLVATAFAVLALPIGFFLTPARVAREREKQEKAWLTPVPPVD